MLTVRVGKTMAKRQNFTRWVLQCMLVLLLVVLLIMLVLQINSNPLKVDWRRALPEGFDTFGQKLHTPSRQSASPCVLKRECPVDHFSFYIQSGAANVVGPKICVQNKLVLGMVLNNGGPGINIVILNGKTGEVTKTASFDMYSGDVKPLIALLESIEKGSAVLMASYDDPSSKLNDAARKLIVELGSSVVETLGFRDNWVFVGGKGAAVKTKFEKHLKNDAATNKYQNWPEIISIEGCIPKFME